MVALLSPVVVLVIVLVLVVWLFLARTISSRKEDARLQFQGSTHGPVAHPSAMKVEHNCPAMERGDTSKKISKLGVISPNDFRGSVARNLALPGQRSERASSLRSE